MIDRALVMATAPDGQTLFDVGVATHVTHRDSESWPSSEVGVKSIDHPQRSPRGGLSTD
jgi:hypothetical protein